MSRVPESEPAPDRASQGAPHPSATRAFLDLSAIDPDHVHANLPCIQCGYNLRTLAHDGRCPECGTPVAVTLQDQALAGASPAELTALADCSASLTMALTAFALSAAVAVACAQLTNIVRVRDLVLIAAWVTAVTSLVVLCWLLIIIQRLARLAPDARGTSKMLSPRALLRNWAGGALGLTALGTIAVLVDASGFAACAMTPAALVSALGLPILLGSILERLARGANDVDLARRFSGLTGLHLVIALTLPCILPALLQPAPNWWQLSLATGAAIVSAYVGRWAYLSAQLANALRNFARRRHMGA